MANEDYIEQQQRYAFIPRPPTAAEEERQSTQTRVSQALVRDPSFPWSLNIRSRNLSGYRAHVTNGILAAARKYKLVLNPVDLSWPGFGPTRGNTGCMYQTENLVRSTNSRMTAVPNGVTLEDHLLTKGILIGRAPHFNFAAYLYNSTCDQYERFLQKLWDDFFAMLGKYDSMLILLSNPPSHSPSMDICAIRLFVNHRRLQPRTPLVESDAVTPVLDIHGQQIQAKQFTGHFAQSHGSTWTISANSSKLRMKNLPLERSRPNNSPDFGQIHKFDGRLLEQEVPSPTADVQQYTRSVQNHKATSKANDLSLSADMRQFTKLGQQNHKSTDGPSRRVHSQQGQFTSRPGGKSKSKKIYLQASTCDNSPTLAKSQEQEGPSRRVRSQQSTRFEENQRACASFILWQLTSRVRWSISKGPLTTIHQIRGKSKSRKIHLQGSRCHHSPDLGKIERAYANFLPSWATSRANDLSVSADMQQFTKLGQNHKFDGRLLELEDPSPRVKVRQFTRFGQKHKFDGRLLEQEDGQDFLGTTKSTILTNHSYYTLPLPTISNLIIYSNAELVPTLHHSIPLLASLDPNNPPDSGRMIRLLMHAWQ
eukprot:scaffold5159_cov112-Cylindrotheca_fusiformis.AAC.28